MLWLQAETQFTLPAPLMLPQTGALNLFILSVSVRIIRRITTTTTQRQNKQSVAKGLSFESSKHCGMCSAIYNSPNAIKTSLFYFSLAVWIVDCRWQLPCGLTNCFSKDLVSLSLSLLQGKQSEQHSFLQMMFLLVFTIFVFLFLISVIKCKVNKK